MQSHGLFQILCVILLFPELQTAIEICSSFSCNQNLHGEIQFPFRVTRNQTSRCGYPGFDLSCNSDGETLLSLPSSSPDPFIIRSILYSDQLLLVSDPNHCIPNRVLNLTQPLSSSPFRYGPDSMAYTFLNCSESDLDRAQLPVGTAVISCLSRINYTVVATYDEGAEEMMVRGGERRCEVIRRVNAAFWWPEMGYGVYAEDISDVMIQLRWDMPQCGDCVIQGGSCGFVSDSSLEVGCRLPPAAGPGFPRSAMYGVMLGVGIPGLLCLIGLTFYISSRVKARHQSRHRANSESSPAVFPQPIILTLGLDRPTIESYPKTILGESKRLPNLSDGTCPICLSEYQPKETLRSIPECNHYFHAECIDEWLRMNATCPVCRNSPQQPPSAVGGC